MEHLLETETLKEKYRMYKANILYIIYIQWTCKYFHTSKASEITSVRVKCHPHYDITSLINCLLLDKMKKKKQRPQHSGSSHTFHVTQT